MNLLQHFEFEFVHRVLVLTLILTLIFLLGSLGLHHLVSLEVCNLSKIEPSLLRLLALVFHLVFRRTENCYGLRFDFFVNL